MLICFMDQETLLKVVESYLWCISEGKRLDSKESEKGEIHIGVPFYTHMIHMLKK